MPIREVVIWLCSLDKAYRVNYKYYVIAVIEQGYNMGYRKYPNYKKPLLIGVVALYGRHDVIQPNSKG